VKANACKPQDEAPPILENPGTLPPRAEGNSTLARAEEDLSAISPPFESQI